MSVNRGLEGFTSLTGFEGKIGFFSFLCETGFDALGSMNGNRRFIVGTNGSLLVFFFGLAILSFLLPLEKSFCVP